MTMTGPAFLKISRDPFIPSVSGPTPVFCTYLTLLPFLCEDVSNQSLLEHLLFDQKMPQTASREGEAVL